MLNPSLTHALSKYIYIWLLCVDTPSMETSRVLLGLACFSFDLKFLNILIIAYLPT